MIDMLITIGAWALIWSSFTLGGSIVGGIVGATIGHFSSESTIDSGSARGANLGTIVGFTLPALYLWVVGMLWALETIGVWSP